MSDLNAASGYWDREVAEPTHIDWMAHPQVRAYIGEAITGSPLGWPLDWFETVTKKRRFQRALSVGCGSGGIDRDLLRRGIAARVDAFDASMHSLHIARTAADREGVGHAIRYFAADFNDPVLQRSVYDLVVFQMSLHHVGKLEKLLREVLLAMKPGGVVYMDEFVGPSRHEWTPLHIASQRAVYQMLPREIRYVAELPLPITHDDPSEGIRSGEIKAQLSVGFRWIDQRNYGGTLLAQIFPGVHWPAAPADLVPRLIESERALLAAGVLSYHQVGVLAPKSGLARQIARLHYYLVPKLKRLAFELKRAIGRS